MGGGGGQVVGAICHIDCGVFVFNFLPDYLSSSNDPVTAIILSPSLDYRRHTSAQRGASAE